VQAKLSSATKDKTLQCFLRNGKIMEQILLEVMLNRMDYREVIRDNQLGFMKGKSSLI